MSKKFYSTTQTLALTTSILLKARSSTSTILDDKEASILADKLAKTAVLHVRWEYKDTAKESLYGDALITRERYQCKEIGRNIIIKEPTVTGCTWLIDFIFSS